MSKWKTFPAIVNVQFVIFKLQSTKTIWVFKVLDVLSQWEQTIQTSQMNECTQLKEKNVKHAANKLSLATLPQREVKMTLPSEKYIFTSCSCQTIQPCYLYLSPPTHNFWTIFQKWEQTYIKKHHHPRSPNFCSFKPAISCNLTWLIKFVSMKNSSTYSFLHWQNEMSVKYWCFMLA